MQLQVKDLVGVIEAGTIAASDSGAATSLVVCGRSVGVTVGLRMVDTGVGMVVAV